MHRRRSFSHGCLIVLFVGGLADAADKPNVLLICVDDLRSELGCLGVDGIQTPHIDRLASEGRLFRHHYVQIAACGPSRCTLLTGRRENRAWDVWGKARRLTREPDTPVSVVHLFRRNGYRTVGIGKVAHKPDGGRQVPFSWDASVAPTARWGTPGNAFFGYADGHSFNQLGAYGSSKRDPRLPYEAADADDHGYADAYNADLAIEQLRDLSQRDQPFLLAVGFYRPHLPFNAPKKYWDMYDEKAIPTAPWPRAPKGVETRLPLHDSYEPTSHYRWPSGKGHVNELEGRTLKHGYWAAVSYVDAQIGRVLEAYRRLGLEKNTIVVLWSDHGWHLGDHGIWGKFTTYDWSLRSPLIIRVPSQPDAGQPTDGLVETIDIYPTLADLCELDAPADLPGESLAPMVRQTGAPGKNAAFSTVYHGKHNGHTWRTDRYRLTRWAPGGAGKIALVELYDYETDPYETTNIAEGNPEIVERLSAQLDVGKTARAKAHGR